ncbi:MAG: GHMP kinase, partial [Caldiserica bacterium]|nr:GHMP kinase [Caldisericota bacterium]
MIITRTPFRTSFLGGGTDLPVVYREIGGAVLSTTIDKYMYVAVNKRFEETIRVAYTRTEIVRRPEELRHEIVREALQAVGIRRQIEVVTIADVPAGTGLGSSSALTVGLLKALYTYRGEEATPERLAREACELEIVRLGHRIGKQDQYAAAFGGFNFIEFHPDEGVTVTPLRLPGELVGEFFGRMRLFYTGLKRRSGEVLAEQSRAAERKLDLYRALKELAYA